MLFECYETIDVPIVETISLRERFLKHLDAVADAFERTVFCFCQPASQPASQPAR